MRGSLRWLWRYPTSVLDIVQYLLLIGVLGIFIYNTGQLGSQVKATKQNTMAIQQVLNKLESQGKARDQAVQDLITNNEQQTLILCKLILGDGTNLSRKEVAEVENICQAKVKQQPSVQSKTKASKSTTHSPAAFPTPTTQPPAEKPQTDPQPPQPAKPVNCTLDLLTIHIGCP